MGTACRNLVAKKKAQGQPIGGRGKLTELRIKELTNYYGSAIKNNKGDIVAMRTAVWASFFHTVSNADNHNHNFCPSESTSWCFYQRAVADDRPPREHRRPLPQDVVAALKPICQRLGDPQLLQRCLDGKTSNSNECFHSLLWSVCPKERWGNLQTIETTLALSVQRFNKGSTALLDMLVQLELMTGPSMEEYVEKEDSNRVVEATRKTSTKEKRRKIDLVRWQEHQQRQNQGVVYDGGTGFDNF